MGWWSQNEEGHSFMAADSGEDMLWGDEPADAFGDALDHVDKAFEEAWGRKPTLEEVKAGLLFTAVLRYGPDLDAYA